MEHVIFVVAKCEYMDVYICRCCENEASDAVESFEVEMSLRDFM